MTVDHHLTLSTSQSVSEQHSLEFMFFHSPFYFVAELNAIISADYTPVPGEDPEKLGDNEFTAGSTLILKCTIEKSTEDMNNNYQWSITRTSSSVGCTKCTNPTLIVGGPPLYSISAGSYRCIINSTLTSRPFIVSVAGECMYNSKYSIIVRLCKSKNMI